MTGTGEWSAAQLEETVGLINLRVGVWNHLEYPDNIPPLGERNADAIKAAHGAIEEIDRAIRGLHAIRGQLVSEIRTDQDARAASVDALLAGCRRDGAR